eukprot:TRINITY_DN6409_c0_g1_i3.p1 TRINITY_DN6409_c0_g1~~TRINITY_DN6409_c0_g1_i3.p1  ORF type:complete len:693 (-),score=217.51 TRINITY_DN6409_c0_g1_i3:1184-3007(-)
MAQHTAVQIIQRVVQKWLLRRSLRALLRAAMSTPEGQMRKWHGIRVRQILSISKKFVRDLTEIVQVFYAPLFTVATGLVASTPSLSWLPEEIKSIFGGIRVVREAHAEFLGNFERSLEQTTPSHLKVGILLQQVVDRISGGHTAYLQSISKNLEKWLSICDSVPQIRKKVKECESSSSSPFLAMLCIPLFHFETNNFLNSLCDTLSVTVKDTPDFSALADSIEKLKLSEENENLLNVGRVSFEAFSVLHLQGQNLIASHRKFLKKGNFLISSTLTHTTHTLLFNDVLLFFFKKTEKDDEKTDYEYAGCVPVLGLSVSETNTSAELHFSGLKFAFTLAHGTLKLILGCTNERERNEWISVLSSTSLSAAANLQNLPENWWKEVRSPLSAAPKTFKSLISTTKEQQILKQGGAVIKQGRVFKRGKILRSGWAPRWLLLQEKQICYFKAVPTTFNSSDQLPLDVTPDRVFPLREVKVRTHTQLTTSASAVVDQVVVSESAKIGRNTTLYRFSLVVALHENPEHTESELLFGCTEKPEAETWVSEVQVAILCESEKAPAMTSPTSTEKASGEAEPQQTRGFKFFGKRLTQPAQSTQQTQKKFRHTTIQKLR